MTVVSDSNNSDSNDSSNSDNSDSSNSDNSDCDSSHSSNSDIRGGRPLVISHKCRLISW